METVFVVLNYYELPHYYLNVFGGFSICFIITLYLQSYIFQFCSWHRVPIHYVLLSNIIALIDDIVKIPLSDLNMMRMYFVLLVMFTMEQQSKIISVLSNIANPDYRMSKVQACDYLGVSRATFDNYVRDGFIPKGVKQEGFKELSWNKADLDIFLASKN